MKKAFMKLTGFLCVAMVSFSVNYKKPVKVLLAAELVGFEVENVQESSSDSNVMHTSLKQLGIVTYINPETNQFAALGHSLSNNRKITAIEGICYDVQIDSDATYKNLEASKNLGKIYLDKESPIGHVYYDSYAGIYGKIDNVVKQKYQEVETSNRYQIKKGNANILIRLDGENLESFKVEILAINYIDNKKNIRIKITDERLINETGGIVQGMSGTPVMQNGKLIGVINCVSIDNPRDAYAIFIDKII